MDWTAARALYGGFRTHLVSVDSIARAASSCAEDVFDDQRVSQQMRQLCSPTARMLFEMLSGHDVAAFRDRRVTLAGPAPPPTFTHEPSVVYVNLTGNTVDVLDDSDGHRLAIVISGGSAKVLQACNGEAPLPSITRLPITDAGDPRLHAGHFTLAEFLQTHTAAAVMTPSEFLSMWGRLKAAAAMGAPTPPKYIPLDFSDSQGTPSSGKSEKGLLMQEAVGAFFDGNTSMSWFVQMPINM
jgi:hypothetical protein